MRQEKLSERLRELGFLIQIPATLAAGPLVGYVLGSILDRWLGADPWMMGGGLMLGAIASIRLMLQLLRKAGTR